MIRSARSSGTTPDVFRASSRSRSRGIMLCARRPSTHAVCSRGHKQCQKVVPVLHRSRNRVVAAPASPHQRVGGMAETRSSVFDQKILPQPLEYEINLMPLLFCALRSDSSGQKSRRPNASAWMRRALSLFSRREATCICQNKALNSTDHCELRQRVTGRPKGSGKRMCWRRHPASESCTWAFRALQAWCVGHILPETGFLFQHGFLSFFFERLLPPRQSS